ncbi:hypothetical protein ILUMI_20685 [Ignelater luminosus]|uniref:HAT C-terminal dimerisation domain-containing protein n=1 Tax=Ignelater luminosus TaxID=2038154 RepID=A0A8K0CKH1_IGNLU|nr:hypothetical protein ILUMI_20685 [Ignelater luminosus]
MLSAEPPSITTPKQMKITDHFPIQNNENSMEERVARMAAKDGLPLSVFVTSSDLRNLFKAKGHSLSRSSTSIRMMVTNYGMTLQLTRIFGSMPATVCVEILRKKLKEFDLDLDIDIVAITTDAASVMVKTGTLILAFQQLCYAHGLQLGILDVIYKKDEHESIQQGQIDVPLENPEAETNNDGDRSNTTDDDRFIVEVSSSSEIERELISDFNDIINKVRKIVRLFKGSPTKNDMLQEYVKKEFGRKIKLDRDCKTRWSSLATMIETFNKLKLCIAKTLIDLGLSTNIEYRFSEHKFCALENLENILNPVKLAVEVLCRQDANLIIAEATLKIMIKKLEDNHSALASKLALSWRRLTMRRVMIKHFIFQRKIYFEKKLKTVIRMQLSLSNSYDNNDDEEVVQAVQITNNNEEVSPFDLTLQQKLELTISSASNVICPAPSRANTLESIIKKKMTLYESGGSMGKYLTFTYNALKGIPPTSVETERPFSAAGYIVSKIRRSLADDTLDMLCFLRKHFQLNADQTNTNISFVNIQLKMILVFVSIVCRLFF